MGHYDNIEAAIIEYYQKKGISVELEAHGSRGPDISGVAVVGKKLVGEIKSEKEVRRDLGGYWGQWNSDRSFGGKEKNYQLKNNYTDEGAGMPSSRNKGWAAVIDGQLRGYCQKENLLSGDLVVENYPAFAQDIGSAMAYLITEKRIEKWAVDTDANDIGYLSIYYCR